MNYAEVRTVGRLLRALFGAFLAVVFVAFNPDIVTTQTVALSVSFVGVIIFYILYTVLLGNRVLTKVNPWVGWAL